MLQAEMLGSILVTSLVTSTSSACQFARGRSQIWVDSRPENSGMLEVIEPMLLRTCHNVLPTVAEGNAAYADRSSMGPMQWVLSPLQRGIG